ncbi:hypothetical protein PLESTM_000538900 [Pleodorina starrii]|nr:hypothetical protein PLESTM_000538900 [Pleodorina starrii]
MGVQAQLRRVPAVHDTGSTSQSPRAAVAAAAVEEDALVASMTQIATGVDNATAAAASPGGAAVEATEASTAHFVTPPVGGFGALLERCHMVTECRP